jgi:hypothetical protein
MSCHPFFFTLLLAVHIKDISAAIPNNALKHRRLTAQKPGMRGICIVACLVSIIRNSEADLAQRQLLQPPPFA